MTQEAIEKVFGATQLLEKALQLEASAHKAVGIEKGIRWFKECYAGRLQVLRTLVQKYHAGKRGKYTLFDFQARCEKQLDTMLAKHDFDIEAVIDKMRLILHQGR